jgi:hypothetical protein
MSGDSYKVAQDKWEDFVVKTWYDRDLYRRALADPALAMQAAGIEVPAGMKVMVVKQGEVEQNTASWSFILSEPPGRLSAEDALKVEANLEKPEGICPTGGAGTAHVYERV